MKKILFSLGFLLASIGAFAQKSLVYKISGNGLDTPSYVMGTVHMICEEDYFWSNAMEQAMAKTSELCLEIDMTDPTVQMSLAMAMMNQGEPKISSYFSKKEYAVLGEKFTALTGQSASMMDMFKPMILASYVTMDLFQCKNGVKAYETELTNKAKASGKPVHGIESAETQVNALSSISDSTIIAMTKAMINSGKDKKATKAYQTMLDQTKELVNLYKSQDVEALFTYSTNTEMFKMNQKVMLDDRNDSWIPKMEKMMKAKPMMFAFGAAHLGGEIGVIYQLKKAGYTVEPVL